MYKQISLELADGKKMKVPMLACGTTAIRYKMIFGGELLADVMSILKAAGAGSANKNRSEELKEAENRQDKVEPEQDKVEPDTSDPKSLQMVIAIAETGKLDTLSKMAYVMSRQAAGADMKKLSFEDYLDWLEQFETMTFLTHSMDIISIYMENRQGGSSLKKSPAPSTAK